jgi:hypothetical protein
MQKNDDADETRRRGAAAADDGAPRHDGSAKKHQP